MDSLERLQGLHADLQAFTETRLANVDRLWQELEDSIQEFKKLLDKPVPIAAERESYNSGKITIDEQEFSINDEFRHLSRAVGTTLQLDEVEAGHVLIQANAGQTSSDDYMVAAAIGRFHDRRDLLLQTLRMTLEQSLNIELDDGVQLIFRDMVTEILDTKTGPASNGSAFASRCLKAMEEVEQWLVKINDQIQSKQLLSQMRGPEFYATLEFQKGSLFKQHEALGAILALLFRANYTVSGDLEKLHRVVSRWHRLELVWIHYLPAFSAAFRQYGSPEGSTSVEDAKRLDRLMASGSQSGDSGYQSRALHAVLEIWWTAEFSGWYREPATEDAESERRAKAVKTALDDQAINLLLTVCSTIQIETWRHPARPELIAILIGDQNGLSMEVDQQTSSYFYTMLMESIETFCEAWITNMPDSIRQLKNEADDQRLLQITAAQDGIITPAQREHVGCLNLESFLVLIAYAFENRPEAAEQFWDDPDSNLYGFLAWSSKRQTVPRVSAFCEMLCAVSEGPENSAAAHTFLMDNSVIVATARSRRVPSMNYQQIFAELELYARKVHERKSTTQVLNTQTIQAPDFNETESPVMLSCYLRLISHLCRHNAETRAYMTTSANFDLSRTLLALASGPVPTYLRAAIFTTLNALLTEASSVIASNMWTTIDDWASGRHETNVILKQNQPPVHTLKALQATLASISASFDQYDAFVELLTSLISPTSSIAVDGQPLPFPQNLGANYRRQGITPYVDFVCGQILGRRIREIGDETQSLSCLYHCLQFVAIGLEGFNENYVTMLDKQTRGPEGPNPPIQDLVYAQCHPFARIMQWIFGVPMNKILLQVLQGKVDEVQSCLPDAPIVLTLLRCIDIINMVLLLQPTYFDLVKPTLKDTDSQRDIQFVGFNSFEGSILSHSGVILDLCQYAATSLLQLSHRSLALLEKLTGSPKLNSDFTGGARGKSRRLVDMLGPNIDTELLPVADSMIARLQIDERELEEGIEATGYLMKDGILAFMDACLSVQKEAPSIAHLLLGFSRIGDHLAITPQLDDGMSLFNAIINIVLEYPDGQDGNLLSWLIHVKSAGMRVLQHLWSAPVSSNVTLGQLRRLNFLGSQFITQSSVSQATVWDGYTLSDPPFWYTTSAEALTEFLSLRACFYDYTSKELASIGSEKIISLQQQVISTLQGKSVSLNGTSQPHLAIFDMFDFADLDISAALEMPELQYFDHIDFDSYRTRPTETRPELYDTDVVTTLLHTIQAQLIEQQMQQPSAKICDPEILSYEVDVVIGLLKARNRWTFTQTAHRETIHAYMNMIVSAVEVIPFDHVSRTQFVMQILQLLIPKLDTYVVGEAPEAIELARAVDSLLLVLSRKSASESTTSRIDDIVAERLFQLFRICIDGISISSNSLELRTVLYSICSQYLTRIRSSETANSDPYRKARGSSMDCVRSASQQLITIISDDAEDGFDTCRLNALDLLSMLVSLARTQESTLVIDALVKANVIEILLEPIRNIASDFAGTSVKQRPYLLTIFESRTFLLLQISRTRLGASALLDAGLLQTLRDSMIFRADPDLGMDLNTSQHSTTDSFSATASKSTSSSSALLNYFVLLSATLRVLLSTFLSRGPENEQIQYLVRTFLADHRPNMVGAFKKAAGVNGKISDVKMRAVLEDCVRCYTGLAVGTGFADFEDTSALGGSRSGDSFS